MPSRRLTAALAAVTLAAIALAAALGPGLFAAPPAASPAPSIEPIAQVTPAPTLATPTPTVAPPTDTPSPPQTAPPTLPPLAIENSPPNDEIFPSRVFRYPAPTETPDQQAGGSGGNGPAPVPAGSGAVATRVVFASLNIDLPIVRGNLKVRGNRNNYPLCDVAQYMEIFVQPGEEGTTYIYAHAQRGMFLPMLRASQRNNGREMLGQRVEVYTAEAKLYIYEVTRVKRHSTDLNIAFNLPAGERQLILQTSEGPPGHRPVLQVRAELVRVEDSSASRATPTPRPRVCLPPR